MPRRQHTRFDQLAVGQTAHEVLQQAGSPDYIECRYLGRGWDEIWEYDHCRHGEWTTLKLRWHHLDKVAVVKSILPGKPDLEHREKYLSDFCPS